MFSFLGFFMKIERKKCLFLGYGKSQTSLIQYIENKKIHKGKKLYVFDVTHKKKFNIDNINKFDVVISFGLREVIKKNILSNINTKIINLHMSYLPYNKGANPNYWSIVNDTIKGVTIHIINNNVDSGNIIFREKAFFNNLNDLTFLRTYLMLKKKLEVLFCKNSNQLLLSNYSPNFKMKKIYEQIKKKKDLPKDISWNENIGKYLIRHR